MSVVNLDLFEYSTDALAQAAYVSSDTAAYDLITQSTGTATKVLGDTSGTETRWSQSFTLSNNTRIISVTQLFGGKVGSPTGNVTCRIETNVSDLPSGILANDNATKIFTPVLDSTNTIVYDTSFILTAGTYWIVYLCANQSTNSYWAIKTSAPSSQYADGVAARSQDAGASWTAQAFDLVFSVKTNALQCFSESTIKNEGTYSLGVIAATTNSLNDTLTRTVASPVDLTGKRYITFDIYSSRTGSNIKLGIHDSGGTTSEITPNITSAGAWQKVIWDISAISDANKDVIDSVIITILNADDVNTFYIDNFVSSDTLTKTVTSKARAKLIGITKTVTSKVRIKLLGITKTVTSKIRVKILAVTKTITSKVRVKLISITKTATSKSRIKLVNITKTVTSKVRIKIINVTKTIEAQSRVKIVNVIKTIQALSRIKLIDNLFTVSSKARIKIVDVTQTIQSLTRVKVLDNIISISGKVRVKLVNITKTIETQTRIKLIDITKTIQALARIKLIDITKTVQSLTRVKLVDILVTVISQARVKILDVTKTVQSQARIKILDVTKTITSQARVKFVALTNTIQSQARVKLIGIATVTAKSRIKVVDTLKTISAKAKVTILGKIKSITSQARVKKVTETTVSCKASITNAVKRYVAEGRKRHRRIRVYNKVLLTGTKLFIEKLILTIFGKVKYFINNLVKIVGFDKFIEYNKSKLNGTVKNINKSLTLILGHNSIKVKSDPKLYGKKLIKNKEIPLIKGSVKFTVDSKKEIKGRESFPQRVSIIAAGFKDIIKAIWLLDLFEEDDNNEQ